MPVKHKSGVQYCRHIDGCSVRPSFNYPNHHGSVFCALHRQVGMVNERQRWTEKNDEAVRLRALLSRRFLTDPITVSCTCVLCKKSLPLSDFSASQRNKSRDSRKCEACLQEVCDSQAAASSDSRLIIDARDGHEIYCHICGEPNFNILHLFVTI